MAFAKFQENRFRIDGEIAENHAILVNLTASIGKIQPPEKKPYWRQKQTRSTTIRSRKAMTVG